MKMIVYKLVNSLCSSIKHKYTIGINELLDDRDGMFFTDSRHIFWYLNYGDILVTAEINDSDGIKYIPDPNMVDDGSSVPGCAVHKCRVLSIEKLNKFNVGVLDIMNADLHADNDALFKYAVLYNSSVLEYLLTRYHEETLEFINRFYGVGV